MRVHFYCDWILRVRSTESEEAAEEQASERSGAESAQSRCSLVLVTRAEYEGAVYPYRVGTVDMTPLGPSHPLCKN